MSTLTLHQTGSRIPLREPEAQHCPIHAWCTDTEVGHIKDEIHSANLGDAVAGGSQVSVRISHDEEHGSTDDWILTIDLGEWIVGGNSNELASEIKREFADVRSIIDQAEAKAWAFYTRAKIGGDRG